MIKYLFFRIFRFQKNIIGTDIFESAFVAVISVALLAALNLFSVFLFIEKHYHLFQKIESLGKNVDNVIYGMYILILIIIFYFVLFYKKKYKKIINEIESKKGKEKRNGNIFAILYQIISVLIFIWALIYNLG